MKGLLLKDLINLKSTARLFLAFLAIFAVLILSTGELGSYSLSIVVLSAMLPFTTVALDERAKWDRTALCAPVKRSTLVLSKYVLGLVLLGIALFAGLLLGLLGGQELSLLLKQLFLIGLSGALILCVMLPLMFRFGAEKGRIVLMLIMAAAFAASFLFNGPDVALPTKDALMDYALILIASVIAALVLSAMWSMGIYRKKEFS